MSIHSGFDHATVERLGERLSVLTRRKSRRVRALFVDIGNKENHHD